MRVVVHPICPWYALWQHHHCWDRRRSSATTVQRVAHCQKVPTQTPHEKARMEALQRGGVALSAVLALQIPHVVPRRWGRCESETLAGRVAAPMSHPPHRCPCHDPSQIATVGVVTAGVRYQGPDAMSLAAMVHGQTEGGAAGGLPAGHDSAVAVAVVAPHSTAAEVYPNAAVLEENLEAEETPAVAGNSVVAEHRSEGLGHPATAGAWVAWVAARRELSLEP